RPRPDLAQIQKTTTQSAQPAAEQQKLREAEQVKDAGAEPAAPAAPQRAIDPTRQRDARRVAAQGGRFPVEQGPNQGASAPVRGPKLGLAGGPRAGLPNPGGNVATPGGPYEAK